MIESRIVYSQALLSPSKEDELEAVIKFWEESTGLKVKQSVDVDGRVIIEFIKEYGL